MKKFNAFVLAFLINGLIFAPCAIPATLGYQIDMLLSQVRTAAGGAITNGHVHFYAAGGTTDKTIWTSVTKATPAANPYNLDANGTAYVFGDGLYRIVIHSAPDVTSPLGVVTHGPTVYDRDNIRYEDFGTTMTRLTVITGDNTGTLSGFKTITGPGTGNISGFDNLTNTGYGGTLRSGDLITKGPWADVRAYGSTATNATVTAAIAGATSGGTVFLPAIFGPYTFSAAVTVNKPLTIISDGAVINVAAGKAGFVIASDNVTISGLTIRGSQSASTEYGERGISVAGTVGDYYDRIRITNNNISNFGGYGIYARYVSGFDFSGNNISSIDYAAIIMSGCSRGTVIGNNINGITSSNGNGYGIETSAEGELEDTHVQSTDITISGNVVSNNTVWKCYGSHGGERIVFSGNTGKNCFIGVGIGAQDNVSNLPEFAPKDIVVAGNILDSGVTNGTGGYGIFLTGAYNSGVVDYATGIISGNTIRGYGSDNAAIGYFGIYAYGTRGMVLSNNLIIDPASRGMHFEFYNIGMSVSGNVIRDVWSNINNAFGIFIVSDYQVGSISGNSIVRGTKSATYINTYGINISTSLTGVNMSFGNNYIDNGATVTLQIQDASAYGHGYYLQGLKSYDPPTLADNAATTTSVTVTGAVWDDSATCTFRNENALNAGMIWTGVVTNTDTVNCTLVNMTGGSVDLATGTLFAVVRRR